MTRPAFITGSHAYGTPHGESDIDLVVHVDDVAALAKILGKEVQTGYGDLQTTQVRFGELNLIVVDAEHYDVWKYGTDKLKRWRDSDGPIERDVACAVFKAERERRGLK